MTATSWPRSCGSEVSTVLCISVGPRPHGLETRVIIKISTLSFPGVSMVIGILCFPAGWDHEQVRGICGKESKDYFLGLCGIRWAFVMAFICVIDAFILSILAVVLSKRKVEPLPPHVSSNNIYKGIV